MVLEQRKLVIKFKPDALFSLLIGQEDVGRNGVLEEEKKLRRAILAREKKEKGKVPTTYLSLGGQAVFFPRCEYYARYVGTTYFDMCNPEYWGTYFRSTPRGGDCARYTSVFFREATYINPQLTRAGKKLDTEKVSDEKKQIKKFFYYIAGSVRSPFTYSPYYRPINDCISKRPAISGEFIYDDLLRYKQQRCKQIVELCGAQKTSHVFSYYRNNYPCVMIRIQAPCFEERLDVDLEGMHKMAMAYYVAIVNTCAHNKSIPIELVIRSSFGHNIPSVDVTESSFRINIGIIPIIYAQVLAESLMKLDEVIKKLLCGTLADFEFVVDGRDFLETKNAEIEAYNLAINKEREEKKARIDLQIAKLAQLKSKSKADKDKLKKLQKASERLSASKALPLWSEGIFETLNLVGDTKNQKVVLQLTRQRRYINLLVDYVIDELMKREEEQDFVLPLVQMISLLSFTKRVGTKTTISMQVTDDDYECRSKKTPWPSSESDALSEAKDSDFWRILTEMCNRLGAKEKFVNRSFRVSGLYAFLEEINKYFVVEVSVAGKEDAGSDSDCECESPALFARKVTVVTGMKAINLACYLARFFIKDRYPYYDPDARYMYYEVESVPSIAALDKHAQKADMRKKAQKQAKKLLFFGIANLK